ncbi:MAG TPA: DUF3168 domain-containing protein [Rhizobiaceae bacterium]|nr:DUF3168 domain-containing protein [Rhizobiaceae bacterium]
MEEAIIDLLLGTAAVTALVGTRVYWGRAPQTEPEKPYAILQRIDGLRDYRMAGSSGYVASRVQIDVYGLTYTSTKKAARALIATLSGYSGPAIQGAFVESERDLPAADAGEVTNLFRTSVDLIIHHSE